jgi:crotonobetainyl-CoA:carnitine CoA-transferase CaiB-like acyl-CoA transferase
VHESTGELDGLVVVDGTTTLAGAYCAKLLADGGATVTMVEPAVGAALRRWSCSGHRPTGEDGALFRFLRHGQRSVTTDDPDRLAALVAGADVVVTSGAGPLGPAAELADADPGLVVVSITPFGLTGPEADRPASDLTLQAESGALGVRGTADRPPIQMGGRVVEWVAGAYAAVAALAAHRRQSADGDGDLIDLSLCEVANLSGSLFADLMHSLAGRPPIDPALPARSVELPSIEPTRDGWVGFNTNTRVQFESFCLLIGRPDLITDEWASLATRVSRAEEWNAIVRAWTTTQTTAEIVEQAVLLRVPVAPVCDGPGVVDLDLVQARDVMVDDPTGTFRMPRRPWTLDDEPVPLPTPAPAIGAHDDAPAPRHRRRPAPRGAHAPPLAGLFVVDLTAWWAGPTASHVFATLGADVVHVESARRMDGVRLTGGMFASLGRERWWECSTFFLQANANKDDVTLALDEPAGRELLLRLIAQADLVIENYTPRVLESFDLDWDVVHATNPRAVMVRMPAFGLTGPWRDRPGFAQTMEQVTGLAWMTGHADDQPRIQRGPCDPNGGVHAAIAALAGLARCDRTGSGCLVEAPMFEAALNVAAELVLEWTAYGNRLERDGNRGPTAAPQNVYATDRPEAWLALACETDAQWRALAAIVGRPELGDDPALATLTGRRRAHDDLDKIVGEWAGGRGVEDAVEELLAAGVPAARVRDPRTSSQQPQMVARGFFETVPHPAAGGHPVPGLPWRSRGVDRWIRRPAPTLGQHNHEVLGGRLGLTAEQIAALEADGIIGTHPVGL